MKTLVKTLIIAFLLIFSLPAPGYGQGGDDLVPPPEFPAQDLRFQHLTTEDGLSEGRVWGIDSGDLSRLVGRDVLLELDDGRFLEGRLGPDASLVGHAVPASSDPWADASDSETR